MNKFVNAAMLMTIMIMISSCASRTKTKKIEAFHVFIEEVGQKNESYTREDWAKADSTYKEFANYFDQPEIKKILTQEEADEIAKLKGNYKGYRFKPKFDETIKDVVDKASELGKEIEGVIETIK